MQSFHAYVEIIIVEFEKRKIRMVFTFKTYFVLLEGN